MRNTAKNLKNRRRLQKHRNKLAQAAKAARKAERKKKG
jgi:hypothetical protein